MPEHLVFVILTIANCKSAKTFVQYAYDVFERAVSAWLATTTIIYLFTVDYLFSHCMVISLLQIWWNYHKSD